jgi:hypothetical protein
MASPPSPLLVPRPRFRDFRSQGAVRVDEIIDSNPVNPIISRLRPNTPPTEFEIDETAGWLFNKGGNFQRETYSRHYRRTFRVDNTITKEEFIPTLPERGIVEALKKLRSGVLPLVVDLPPALYTLSADPTTWGLMYEYIWSNILLGPFIYGKQRSGKRYYHNEDQFEVYDKTEDEPAEITVQPSIDRQGDAKMMYWEKVIMCAHKPRTPQATYFVVEYEIPSEEKVVDYIRYMRNQNSTVRFLNILYHNLLVPYVFGKAPET